MKYELRTPVGTYRADNIIELMYGVVPHGMFYPENRDKIIRDFEVQEAYSRLRGCTDTPLVVTL